MHLNECGTFIDKYYILTLFLDTTVTKKPVGKKLVLDNSREYYITLNLGSFDRSIDIRKTSRFFNHVKKD